MNLKEKRKAAFNTFWQLINSGNPETGYYDDCRKEWRYMFPVKEGTIEFILNKSRRFYNLDVYYFDFNDKSYHRTERILFLSRWQKFRLKSAARRRVKREAETAINKLLDSFPAK